MWNFCKDRLIQSSFGKFIIVGSTGFVLDSGLTVLFMHTFGYSPLVARMFSFLFVSLFCWQLNRRWAFAVTHGAHLREYGRYFAINLVAAALNLTVYSVMIDTLPHSISGTVLAVAIGTLSGVGISFTGMRHWVFARR